MFSNKPDIDPPKGLDNPDFPEQDFTELYHLLEKHEGEARRLANTEIRGTKSWAEIREHIKNIVDIQLAAISNFLERHFYEGDQTRKNLYKTRIHQYSNLAASGGWVIGREWGERDPGLREALSEKKTLDIELLPDGAVKLLRLAVFEIYSIFYFPHKFYYESRYGRRTRKQREPHMRDTYQSMMKGVLICFHSGIKSSENDKSEQENQGLY